MRTSGRCTMASSLSRRPHSVKHSLRGATTQEVVTTSCTCFPRRCMIRAHILPNVSWILANLSEFYALCCSMMVDSMSNGGGDVMCFGFFLYWLVGVVLMLKIHSGIRFNRPSLLGCSCVQIVLPTVGGGWLNAWKSVTASRRHFIRTGVNAAQAEALATVARME